MFTMGCWRGLVEYYEAGGAIRVNDSYNLQLCRYMRHGECMDRVFARIGQRSLSDSPRFARAIRVNDS